jgi:hypothetical protein
VLVLIFHGTAPADAGPLVGALAEARWALADRQRGAFLAAGADAVEVVAGPPDGLAFGERLSSELRARGVVPATGRGAATGSSAATGRGAATVLGHATASSAAAGPGHATGRSAAAPPGGVVVLGSGSIPLATAADLRRFVEVAAGPAGYALANNRYSADVVAISRAADLAGLPPLPADNALPRWLAERADMAVADLRLHWRLGVDIDTPLDLVLLRDPAARGLLAAAPLIGERLATLADVMSNRRAELLVAGRISATTLKWLERGVACRVRALVEERGLRAASRLAQAEAGRAAAEAMAAGATAQSTAGATPATVGATLQRPPHSVLGELLDRDGPEALARTVARLADAAVIDTRVLMAHRYGADETAWPSPEDRFASDLLLDASIADPWLRALTASATSAPSDHPILLGGHTLVNGGLRLLATRARAGVR